MMVFFLLLLKFLLVSSVVCMSFGNFEKCKQNSFLHLHHWCWVHHSVCHLYQSHTTDCTSSARSSSSILIMLYCYFHNDQLPIHHLNQAAESVLELETIESPLFHHHQREKTIDNSLNVFKQAVRENLGLVSLFLDNQSNCMLRICKTVSDDTGRILLCVVVICLCVHGKLQSQLILEHCCENSRYMYVGPTHWCVRSWLTACCQGRQQPLWLWPCVVKKFKLSTGFPTIWPTFFYCNLFYICKYFHPSRQNQT